MKLNYEEMKDIFGLIYKNYHYLKGHSSCIQEEFNSYLSGSQDSLNDAINQLKKGIEIDKNLELKRIDNMREQFNNLPLWEKLNWQIKNKKMNFDSTAEERKKKCEEDYQNSLDNIEVKYIEKNKIYTVNAPELIKEGDTLYVVITNQNALEMGLYEAVVHKVNYTVMKNGTVDVDARLLIQESGEDHYFSFSGNEKEFTSRHTYHHIFTNKDEAIEFHNNEIHQKLRNMEQRIIKINNKPNI